jgi:hypothetical protein
MTKMTKVLLVLSVISLVSGLVFVTGLINVSELALLYVTLPAGAIFLGLFMLSKMLEKETALYDAEQLKILAAVKSRTQQAAPFPDAAGTHDTLAKSHSVCG